MGFQAFANLLENEGFDWNEPVPENFLYKNKLNPLTLIESGLLTMNGRHETNPECSCGGSGRIIYKANKPHFICDDCLTGYPVEEGEYQEYKTSLKGIGEIISNGLVGDTFTSAIIQNRLLSLGVIADKIADYDVYLVRGASWKDADLILSKCKPTTAQKSSIVITLTSENINLPKNRMIQVKLWELLKTPIEAIVVDDEYLAKAVRFAFVGGKGIAKEINLLHAKGYLDSAIESGEIKEGQKKQAQDLMKLMFGVAKPDFHKIWMEAAPAHFHGAGRR